MKPSMRLRKSTSTAAASLLLVALMLSGCASEAPSVTNPAITSSPTETTQSAAEATEDALPPNAVEAIDTVETNFGDCVTALSDPGEYTYRAKSSPEGAGIVTFKSETHILVWDTGYSKTGALLAFPSLSTDDLFWDSGCYD